MGGGARFSTPVQTVPGVHPASYTMGTGSFPGVKRPGRGVDNPLPFSAEVKERVELCILIVCYVFCLYIFIVLAGTLRLP